MFIGGPFFMDFLKSLVTAHHKKFILQKRKTRFKMYFKLFYIIKHLPSKL